MLSFKEMIKGASLSAMVCGTLSVQATSDALNLNQVRANLRQACLSGEISNGPEISNFLKNNYEIKIDFDIGHSAPQGRFIQKRGKDALYVVELADSSAHYWTFEPTKYKKSFSGGSSDFTYSITKYTSKGIEQREITISDLLFGADEVGGDKKFCTVAIEEKKKTNPEQLVKNIKSILLVRHLVDSLKSYAKVDLTSTIEKFRNSPTASETRKQLADLLLSDGNRDDFGLISNYELAFGEKSFEELKQELVGKLYYDESVRYMTEDINALPKLDYSALAKESQKLIAEILASDVNLENQRQYQLSKQQVTTKKGSKLVEDLRQFGIYENVDRIIKMK